MRGRWARSSDLCSGEEITIVLVISSSPIVLGAMPAEESQQHLAKCGISVRENYIPYSLFSCDTRVGVGTFLACPNVLRRWLESFMVEVSGCGARGWELSAPVPVPPGGRASLCELGQAAQSQVTP